MFLFVLLLLAFPVPGLIVQRGQIPFNQKIFIQEEGRYRTVMEEVAVLGFLLQISFGSVQLKRSMHL